MTCHHPLDAWRSFNELTSTGKGAIVFSRPAGPAQAITVPCGQCRGCRLAKSQEWALRVIHEASLYDENCFVTLTYDDENMPENGSLVKAHHQQFMKDLRKKFHQKIRFFMCGEYGDDFARPHYHFILFNVQFTPRHLVNERDGNKVYQSDLLDELWPYGFAWIGDVTWQSAAYVARYCMKKCNGDYALDKYVTLLDEDSGECIIREPDYICMSRRPGIAKAWLAYFFADCRKGFLTHDSKRFKIPRFYEQALTAAEVEWIDEVRAKRKEVALDKKVTRKRLLGIEAAETKNASRLRRSL